MKKATSLLIGTGLLFSASLVLAQTVSAADAPTAKTAGSVTFEKDDNPVIPGEDEAIKLIQPGTKETFIYMKPKEGTASPGALHLSFVPNIRFGRVKISSSSKQYKALPLAYTTTEPAEGQAVNATYDKFIPPFVQVIDESGTEKKFTVTLASTGFKDTAGSTADLLNTRIKLTGQKLNNNIMNKEAADTAATGVLDGFAADGITLDGDAKPVLTSLDGTKTNASASSNVFHAAYLSTKTDYTATTPIENILLDVPAGERAKHDMTYTTELLWTLNNVG